METVPPNMAQGPPPPFEVVDAIRLCSVDDVQQFNRDTVKERIASEIFHDDHNLVMEKSYSDLKDDLK